MTISIQYNGIELTNYLDAVIDITRNVGQNRTPSLVKIGHTDGQRFQYTTASEGTITITAIIRNQKTERRRLLAQVLMQSEPAKLIFSDEPGLYYLAITTGQQTLAEQFLHNTLTLTFIVPDAIAHSVATQTADNMPYKDVPVNLLTGTSTPVQAAGNSGSNNAFIAYKFGGGFLSDIIKIGDSIALSFDWSVADQGAAGTLIAQLDKAPWAINRAPAINISSGSGHYFKTTIADANLAKSSADGIQIRLDSVSTIISISNMKFELGTTASPWSPNPADPEYYTDTITVHNGGTYPVYPVIEATMHGDNGLVAFVNDQGGVLQFGDPEEVDGVIKTRAEQVLRVGFDSDPGGIANNASGATNYPNYQYVNGEVNKRIGSMQFVRDSFGGTSMQPIFDNAGQNYWGGPSRELPIKVNSAGVNTGNCWTVVRVQFDTSSKARGRLEYTLCNGNDVVMSIVLRDSTNVGDQMAMECWNQGTLLDTFYLDRKVFKNGRYFQLMLYRFSARIGFQIAPVTSVTVDAKTDSVTLGKAVFKEYQIANHVPITAASIWFERWQQTQHTIMGVSDLLFSWTDVEYWDDLANRFSDGDVVTADVANKAILVNGVEDMTLHTVGNTWDKFVLQPGDNTIKPIQSSWAKTPLDVSVHFREAYY